MRTPAVLYAAKSTQDKHASIPTQLADGRAKAETEGWEIVGEFHDERFSAYSGNRGPGLKAATDLAEAVAAERGTTCMLVTQHSDRFARGAGDKPGASDSLIEVWHRMRRVNVHLRTKQNDPMMERPVTVAVASEQAYEESKRKSEAVKDGMRRRREKGLAMGGKRRFAYHFEAGDLVLDHAMRPVVERIFDEFIAGRSDAAIMRDLLAEGIPTAEGGKWHEATVREILVNPLYKGWLQTKEGAIPGHHEPCVSEEKWRKAQDLRAARGATGKGRGRHTSGKHLFRKGMLRCGCGCGGAMVPRTRRASKGRRGRATAETYESYEHHRDKSLCATMPLKRREIDTAVFSYFERVVLDVDATRVQMVEARDRRLAEVRGLHEQATGEQHRAEERLSRVRRDYMDDRLSPEDWGAFRDELTGDLGAARAEVERLREQATETREWAAWLDAEQATVEKLSELRAAIAGEVADGEGDLDSVRAALSRLFDHFIVRRVGPGDRVHAELAWIADDLILEPVIREEAIEGHTDLRPVFRREAVYASGATNPGSPSSCPAPPPPMAWRTPSTRSKRSTPRLT